VHVIQRGNNRNVIFTSDRDIAIYAHYLHEGARKFQIQVHGWVFMTNHVHLLMTPSQDDSISKLFQFLGRLYVRYFNFTYSRTGTLFEGRFRSSLVQQDRYFLACLRYIELNPVRAGITLRPEYYKWSSYTAHATSVRPSIWTPHKTYLNLGKTSGQRRKRYRELIQSAVNQDDLRKIRHSVNSGLTLGSAEFREQVERLRL
jgi:putative transposase